MVRSDVYHVVTQCQSNFKSSGKAVQFSIWIGLFSFQTTVTVTAFSTSHDRLGLVLSHGTLSKTRPLFSFIFFPLWLFIIPTMSKWMGF